MAPMTTPGTDRALTDRIVWIDCEMTGLSLEADALIEVAALVTDFELNQLGDGVDVVIKPPAEALAQMDPFVRNMHTSSGLLEELDGGTTMEDAQAQVLAYIREWVPEPRKAPLGGNTVGTDAMREQVRAGASGFKVHEDWGATPAAIDAALRLAQEADLDLVEVAPTAWSSAA